MPRKTLLTLVFGSILTLWGLFIAPGYVSASSTIYDGFQCDSAASSFSSADNPLKWNFPFQVGLFSSVSSGTFNTGLNPAGIWLEIRNASDTLLASSSVAGGTGEVDVSFPLTALDPGQDYYFWINAGSVATHQITFNNNCTAPLAAYEDRLKVKLFGAGGVGLNFPVNGSTIPDFQNWVVALPGATSTIREIGVLYSSGNMVFSDRAFWFLEAQSDPFPLKKDHLLWFPPLAIPVEWSATPFVVFLDDSTIYGDEVIFFIDPNEPPPAETSSTILAVPNSLGLGETSSTIPTTVNCQITTSTFINDPVGNIQNGICNALTFLFVMNSAQTDALSNNYQATIDAIEKKPPFGYLGPVVSALENFQTPTSSTSSQLISASGTAAFAPIFEPLDLGIASGIWLLLVFWIFHRARLIEI